MHPPNHEETWQHLCGAAYRKKVRAEVENEHIIEIAVCPHISEERMVILVETKEAVRDMLKILGSVAEGLEEFRRRN